MRQDKTRCVFLLCFILEVSSFSLFDLQNSYVQFEGLRNSTDGKLGVSFRCKTYAKTGLLFYVDNEGNGEYLSLYLRNGFLVLELGYGAGKSYKTRSNAVINDVQWHKIEVELNLFHAEYKIDNTTQTVFNISKIQLTSDVFVGGFPHDMDFFLLSHDTMVFEQRFLGCVEDMKFSIGDENRTRAQVLKSSGMDSECKDACKAGNPCQNSGVCVNKFAMTECECTETGHFGKLCEKELPIVGISSPQHRVTFDVPSAYVVVSPEMTSMSVRVRSSKADGVFFYTTYNGDYVVLELTSGKIAASVNLGSGSITIATKNDAYNDNQWHHVRLERTKRLVNMTVDNLDSSNGETPGLFDKFHFPDKKTSFVIGGLAYENKTKLKSLSQTKFTGCLQELVFNGYDLFSKFNTTKEVVSTGKFRKTCPEMPVDARTTSKTDIPNATTKTPPAVYSVTSPSKATQTLPCIFLGIPCKATTASMPSSQAHVVTSTHSSVDPTSHLRTHSSIDQSNTGMNGRNQTTIGLKISKPTIHRTSQRTSDDVKSTEFPATEKATEANDVGQITGEVIMASRNERSEGDFTIWFILAALVGLVAFVLAILIIVKVNSTNKKRYAVKGKKYKKDYWEDTGTFQQSTESKLLV